MGATFTHAEIEDGAIEEFSRGLLQFVARGLPIAQFETAAPSGAA